MWRIYWGSLVVLFLIGAFTSVFVRVANASRTYLSESLRARIAVSDLVKARDLRTNGITLHIILNDGSVRSMSLPMYSEGLNPDESFEFFQPLSQEEIIARDIHGLPVAPRSRIDAHAITQFLSQSLADALHDPTNARFVLSQGNVVIADDAPGQSLAFNDIIQSVDSIARELDSGVITVHAVTTEAPTKRGQLEGLVGLAKKIAKSPGYILHFGTYSVRQTGMNILSMLTYDPSRRSLTPDEDRLYAYLKEFANSLIDEPMSEPIFGTKSGKLVITKEGRDGHDVDVADLRQTMDTWINDIAEDSGGAEASLGTINYTLKITTTRPRLDLKGLGYLGITDLVGSAVTSFKGSSADRKHNITLGASRVHGFIVEPGEMFSLVRAIGYAEKENGYREEYVIKDGRSRKEAGGGLCQVATTFFRASLDAGLSITERHNHRYVVGYYGPGLDAGIYGIDHDFRFINDFNSPLLVQTFVKGTDLYVQFFARSDHRSAITTKPVETDVQPPPPPDYRFSKTIPFGKTECTDRPREGMVSYATTTIRYANGSFVTHLWKSEYDPWPKICLIGTGGLDIYQVDN